MSEFDTNLEQKNLSKLQIEIIKLRSIIRYHRDQEGDDRCWLDDELLYESLPETANISPSLPSKEFFMDKCTRFHSKRQDPNQKRKANKPSQIPMDEDVRTLDEDVKNMSEEEQNKEIARLKQAIRLHRNIGDNQRSWQDDKRLYQALNENSIYDTTLPDQDKFLANCDQLFSIKGKPSKLNNSK